ncbi:hypothetical protein [Ectobacillus ponti]|uniref:Histone acetyltransferase n=1 Tax=Ectobacillus ponti TaxID=2961894 RepID=A0AA42BP11_9BACI|nr:hypothetical protein [Ectobacillus ponti]MCP8968590.1 hypothetical protein [Ectobacillus ponti]
MRTFYMDLRLLQPSRLYISQGKLDRLKHSAFNPFNYHNHAPLPIQRLGGTIFLTDGHTRAYSYYRSGVQAVRVYWDDDELDMDLYETCLRWCAEEGIRWIGDLDHRVLPHEEYVEAWIHRCERAAAH